GDLGGIYAQRFSSAGSTVGNEFRVNTYTTNDQRLPAIASSPSGEFVVAWASLEQDGSDYGIYAQRFGLVAPNTAPTISDIGNSTINEDGNTGALNFLVNDGETPAGSLTVTATSNNPTLVPNNPGNLGLGGSGSSRNLTVIPSANQSGTATITVTVSDGDLSATDTFLLTVNAVNDAPGFTLVGSSPNINEDAGAQTVSNFLTGITPGPNEAGQTVTFSTTNNNHALFSGQPAIDAAGTLTYTPAPNASGVATVTVTAQDNGGTANGGVDTSAPQTFTITVNPVADTPTVTNASTNEDIQTAAGLVISRNAVDGSEVSHFKITNITNGTLFLNDGITPIPTNSFIPFAQANAGLKFTPTANFFGTGTFGVQAATSNSDGGLGGSVVTATISVNAVNDAPGFTLGSSPNINEDASAQTVSNFLTGISPGPNEAGQTVTFNTSNDNNALFSVQPAVDAAGTLTYALTPDVSGVATVTVIAQDDGGTANGGVDTSAPQAFAITVNPVNDAPSFGFPVSTVESKEDAGGQTFAAFATGIVAGPADEAGQTLTFQLTANTNPGLFSAMPAIDAAGTLTYTSAPDASGSAIVTFVLQDNGGTANGGVDTSIPQTFSITVIPQPRVSVTALDNQATEVGFDNGVFRLDLDKPEDTDLTIAYSLGGTASNGMDYNFLSNTVVVPAGSTRVEISVVARADRDIEGTETVMLTLQPGIGYNLSNTITAQVEILDFVFDGANVPGSGVLSSNTPFGSLILGNNNSNRIAGGDLNDTIAAFAGDDVVFGFGGNDSIDGGLGNDTLNGGEGNDTLVGSVGNNTLTGDIGNDVFVLRTTGSFDILTDFEDGIDRIRTVPVTTFSAAVGASFLNAAQDGADTVLSVNGMNIARLVNFTASNFSGADLI
ncbi:MAG: hypothetical protein HC918_07595, partial [Oscillatoriales cyanobacterium SM2_1_8]|nr:hypothetical protein [Oscillatoriales cyanobacterium SM2_1_8]